MITTLSDKTKMTKVKAASASGTTDVVTDIIDTQGALGVVIMTSLGTANAGNFLSLQQGDQSDGSDMANVAGSKITTAADGMTVISELYRPRDRFIRAKITRGTASTVGEIYAFLTNPNIIPVENSVANVSVCKVLISPLEGAI